MMYFTTHLNEYRPKNRACAELGDWIKEFKHVLFKDELSLDAFKEEVRQKVAEINAQFPKVRTIEVRIDNNQIRASVRTSCGIPDEVFILDYKKVRSTYAFSESLPGNQVLEAKEGGQQ